MLATGEIMSPIAAPAAPHVESARGLIGTYLKAVRAHQLYPRHSKIRQEHIEEFAGKVLAHVEKFGETELRIHQATITWKDDVVYEERDSQKSLAFRLFVGGVRRLKFLPGVGVEEAQSFVDVLARTFEKDATTDDLRTAVWERGFQHVHFSITDDLFTQSEEKEFAEFLEENRVDPSSAADARTECDGELAELQRLPEAEAPQADEAALLRVTAAERDALAQEVEAERTRDLFGEFSEFLVEELESECSEQVQSQIADFVEHVLALGEILRAAQFLKALRDLASAATDSGKQRLLAEVVERIGRSQVVPKLQPLIPSLVDGDRDALFLLLVAVGEPSVAPLCELLESPARDGAAAALRVLAPRYAKALVPYLRDPRTNVVRAVVSILAETGNADTATAFLPALRHTDVAVRRETIRALSRFGGRQATDLFLTALEDPVYEVRALALGAIAETRDPKAAGPLLRRINDPSFHGMSNYEKRESFRTLARIGTAEITTALIRALNTTSLLRRAKVDEMRCLAASALGIIGTQPARHALSLHEKDRSDEVRRAVAGALRESAAKPAPKK